MNWDDLSNKEKDRLLCEKILEFECFKSQDGLEWFNYHYDLGFWRYSSDKKLMTEFLEKLGQKNIAIELIVKGNTYLCRMYNSSDFHEQLPFSNANNIINACSLAAYRYYS